MSLARHTHKGTSKIAHSTLVSQGQASRRNAYCIMRLARFGIFRGAHKGAVASIRKWLEEHGVTP
jgi:hypothetical protein